MKFDIDERVAIVTGGISGIGATCVRLLADLGAYVVITDIATDSARRMQVERAVEVDRHDSLPLRRG
jgi:NAD(P)-dependent dehydrogenase (short-subunit alcohol dehydrogenase family)